jgi:hypothetical protein
MANNKKSARTIRERYGTPDDPTKFWRDNGRKGNAMQAKRPFDDPNKARAAANKRWHPTLV